MLFVIMASFTKISKIHFRTHNYIWSRQKIVVKTDVDIEFEIKEKVQNAFIQSSLNEIIILFFRFPIFREIISKMFAMKH